MVLKSSTKNLTSQKIDLTYANNANEKMEKSALKKKSLKYTYLSEEIQKET